MMFIAHRGNINGPNSDMENKPEYIKIALDKGYYVEVDVWMINKILYLGHDKPQYKCPSSLLENECVIFHAKNIDALEFLVQNSIHCFSHDKDEVVLTSKGFLWTFPGCPVVSSSIAVMPEIVDNWDISKCFAVCSDYVESRNKYRYKNIK